LGRKIWAGKFGRENLAGKFSGKNWRENFAGYFTRKFGGKIWREILQRAFFNNQKSIKRTEQWKM
jgi:hypothetical protein